MFLKRSLTALGAAAILAATTVMPAFADEELPVPKADENGVYCQAGIIWQIRDQWDHKTEIDREPTDEKETVTLDGTYKNVNITGNGEYTVEMSGYHVEDEWIEAGIQVGYLGAELNLDFDTYSDVEEHKGVLFEIKKATIDGVEYTFTNEKNEEGEYPQVLEDPENTTDGQKVIKIKNSWGWTEPPAHITPAMTSDAWTTTDPITITFEVTGLPTDKIEGYENEFYEQVYGNGTIDAAGGDDASSEEEASSVEESKADESVAESKAADSSKADASSTASSSSDSSSKSDSKDSNIGLIAGIAGGAVLVIIIIAVIVKKKS